mmetsp:Transcript_11242/g.41152  ORF Transcript_11242/g.41152 Transcript_11242/m.41152 type:complete len:202 (+) Transcript_11242:1832-2437(+)
MHLSRGGASGGVARATNQPTARPLLGRPPLLSLLLGAHAAGGGAVELRELRRALAAEEVAQARVLLEEARVLLALARRLLLQRGALQLRGLALRRGVVPLGLRRRARHPQRLDLRLVVGVRGLFCSPGPPAAAAALLLLLRPLPPLLLVLLLLQERLRALRLLLQHRQRPLQALRLAAPLVQVREQQEDYHAPRRAGKMCP